MAWTSTPVAFSGTPKKGALLIKPCDIYIGTKADGSDAVKVGYTNQKIDFSITEEKKPYKQNGVKVSEAKISKEGKAAFEFHEYDPNILATALGQSSILVDSVSGKKRVIVTAECKAAVERYLCGKSETMEGQPVTFAIPCGSMSVSSIPFGGGNDSPEFMKIAVEVEALACTVDGSNLLAMWTWDPLS